MDEDNRREAERAHDFHKEDTLKLTEATINNANIALRTLLLMNGASAIAALGFIGNLLSNERITAGRDLTSLAEPVSWFAWGVGFAGTAIGFAFFTNYSLVSRSTALEKRLERPFIAETFDSLVLLRVSYVFEFLTTLFGLAALVSFILGTTRTTSAIVGLF